MSWPVLVQVAAPFLWCGAVLGISFLETPLKFRAPGITVALGVGIGRLVFRALNALEVLLALALTVAVLVAPTTDVVPLALGGLWALLLWQALVVRRRLDRRAVEVVDGTGEAGSRWHLVYIGLEVVKVVALPVLGAFALAGALA
ncbi:hypothetical protein [Pseudonocardia lacus]|jgi:hypothetical protein|uniref:hypothetical protein n=1 Tax=Pseudonocardia lacus TaxID=2835865 RepID=UPI001BDC27D4|nr:hypothetical protein [Pseudonocardia lacus]